jgi:hypothetical protein
MKRIKQTVLVAAIALCALPALAGGFQCNPPLIAHTNPNSTNGDFSAVVKLEAVKLAPLTTGFGATANRANELSVLDGKLYLVQAEGEKFSVRNQPTKGEGAVVMVAASPDAWKEAGKVEGAGSFDGLNFALDNAADDAKCGDNAQFAFKIVGHANSVKWSVINGPTKTVHMTSNDVPVTVFGIYSKTDKDRLRMAKGYNLHAHVYLPGRDMAAHVDEIDLKDGGMLYLPAAN